MSPSYTDSPPSYPAILSPEITVERGREVKMHPKRSLELLDQLKSLGFTDAAFAQLHHFRLKGRRDHISAHRKYCEKITSFQGDGENERVQLRLELVLHAYRSSGFTSHDPRVFVALADAAFHEIPPVAVTPNPALNRTRAKVARSG